jgi:hypothetical protein
MVIAFAAASTGTMPPKWSIDVDLPGTLEIGTKGILVTLEASAPPQVVFGRGDNWGPLDGEGGSAPWTGRGAFFIPSGVTRAHGRIEGAATSGGLCLPTPVPSGEFLRVVESREVATWSVGALSAPGQAVVDTRDVMFHVVVEATRRPEVSVVLLAPDPGKKVSGLSLGGERSARGWVFHAGVVKTGVTADKWPWPVEVRYAVSAVMYGFCDAPGECKRPEGETLRIQAVEPDP